MGEHRDEIAKELGTKAVPAIGKAAGEKWKALPAAKKAPYEKKAEEAKAQYETAMEAFKSSGGTVAKRKSKKDAKEGKPQKDKDAPKKPAGGAFGVFLADKREEIKKLLPADHKITDVTKKASELWKAIKEDDKKKYEAQYVKKAEAYKVALEEYKKTHGKDAEDDDEDEASEAAESPKKEEAKKEKAKAKASPKKRAAPDAKAADAAEAPPAKKGRKGKEEKEAPQVSLGADVLAEAKKHGWENQLKNLACRPDVIASGKDAKALLKALESSKGLVNPAKRALLGA